MATQSRHLFVGPIVKRGNLPRQTWWENEAWSEAKTIATVAAAECHRRVTIVCHKTFFNVAVILIMLDRMENRRHGFFIVTLCGGVHNSAGKANGRYSLWGLVEG